MPMNPKDDALANENRMIIDTLKLELGIKTDAAAAKLVGITKDAISMMKKRKNWGKHRKPPSDDGSLKLFRHRKSK